MANTEYKKTQIYQRLMTFQKSRKNVTRYVLENWTNDRIILQRLKIMVYLFIVISITMYEWFSQSHLK